MTEQMNELLNCIEARGVLVHPPRAVRQSSRPFARDEDEDPADGDEAVFE